MQVKLENTMQLSNQEDAQAVTEVLSKASEQKPKRKVQKQSNGTNNKGNKEVKIDLKTVEKLSSKMSDKELDKAIQQALEEQEKVLTNTAEPEVHDFTQFHNQEVALEKGGKFKIYVKGKTYTCSVYTPEMLDQHDNREFLQEDGYEVDLPKMFKYSVKTPLGNYLFINAKTYTQAQDVAYYLYEGKVGCVSGSRY